MTEPIPNSSGRDGCVNPPALLEFQRRMAKMGIQVRLPTRDPNWELPDPVDLNGVSLSEMVVRLRRCGP